MGRSRITPVLVGGAAMVAGALLVLVSPGVTARPGMLSSAALPDLCAGQPGSTALRTPAPAYSPVPTTNVARGPAHRPAAAQACPTDTGTPTVLPPTEWPPRRIEPPTSPERAPLYALPLPYSTGVWGPPKSTGPPSPEPESDWSIAPARAGSGVASAGAAAGGTRAHQVAAAAPLSQPRQAAAPAAVPGTPDAGSDGYLIVGVVLLLAGGGLIVLARGIEAARPRRHRRHGAHRHVI
jgi:hypothetical protein